jgi:hypothetical protein
MAENLEAIVTFEWATETSLFEQNISNLNLNQKFFLPHKPLSTEGKVVFYWFPNILSGWVWFQFGDLLSIKST